MFVTYNEEVLQGACVVYFFSNKTWEYSNWQEAGAQFPNNQRANIDFTYGVFEFSSMPDSGFDVAIRYDVLRKIFWC